jgi:hypothetical protein
MTESFRTYRQIGTCQETGFRLSTVFRHKLFGEDRSGRPRILDRNRLILCGYQTHFCVLRSAVRESCRWSRLAV